MSRHKGSDHPPRAVLEAFALGMLGDRESEKVEAHLAICPPCGQVAQAAPDDALVALLRR